MLAQADRFLKQRVERPACSNAVAESAAGSRLYAELSRGVKVEPRDWTTR